MADSYFPGRPLKRAQKAAGLCPGARKPRPGGMELWIDQFCVARGFQRRGIGGLFLLMVGEEARRAGLNAMVLTTERGFPAEDFYLKNGFLCLDGLATFVKNLK